MSVTEKEFFARLYSEGKIVAEQEGCPFKKGDIVTFTNEYGVKFFHKKVAGIATVHPLLKYGNKVYLHGEETPYWFPLKISELTKE